MPYRDFSNHRILTTTEQKSMQYLCFILTLLLRSSGWKEQVPGTTSTENAFETVDVFIRSQTNSQTPTNDNLDNDFRAGAWINVSDELYTLKDMTVLIFELSLLDEQSNNDIHQRILGTYACDSIPGFCERDATLIRHWHPKKSRQYQKIASHSLQTLLLYNKVPMQASRMPQSHMNAFKISLDLLQAPGSRWYLVCCENLFAFWKNSGFCAQAS